MQNRADALAATEQQIQALLAAVRAATQRTSQTTEGAHVLSRQARALLELAREDMLSELLVQQGGVEAITPLVDLSDRVHTSLQDVSRCACSVLAAVAARPEYKHVASGALPALFRLLQPHNRNASTARHAADAVAALVTDSRAMQDLVRESGGIELLVQLLDASDARTQRSAAAALRAAAARNEATKQHLAAPACGALARIVQLLQSKDRAVSNKAMQVLGDLVHSVQDARTAALQAGAMAPLVRLLGSSHRDTQHAAALLVGQLAAPPLDVAALAASLGQTVESALVPALLPLLSATDARVQEMGAFALARLAQAPAFQAAIIEANGLPPLLQLLNSQASGTQYNASFALYELADSPSSLPMFHASGGVQHLYVTSQRLPRGPTKACVDRCLLRLEQHKAAASRGDAGSQMQHAAAAAAAAAAAPMPAPAPAAGAAAGLTLAPLVAPAGPDPEDILLASPLARLPAAAGATLFGKCLLALGVDAADSIAQPAALALPDLVIAPPLRLPTIDEIVAAEAAAAVAATELGGGSSGPLGIAGDAPASASALRLLQEQQQQRAVLSSASLAELQQCAAAVELRLLLLQQQQQQHRVPLLGARLRRLCTRIHTTAQQQQAAALTLATRQDLLNAAAVATASMGGASSSSSSTAAAAHAGMLAASASAVGQAVSCLLKLLAHDLSQGCPDAGSVRSLRVSTTRWRRAVHALNHAAAQHAQLGAPACHGAGSRAAAAAGQAVAFLLLLLLLAVLAAAVVLQQPDAIVRHLSLRAAAHVAIAAGTVLQQHLSVLLDDATAFFALGAAPFLPPGLTRWTGQAVAALLMVVGVCRLLPVVHLRAGKGSVGAPAADDAAGQSTQLQHTLAQGGAACGSPRRDASRSRDQAAKRPAAGVVGGASDKLVM